MGAVETKTYTCDFCNRKSEMVEPYQGDSVWEFEWFRIRSDKPYAFRGPNDLIDAQVFCTLKCLRAALDRYIYSA